MVKKTQVLALIYFNCRIPILSKWRGQISLTSAWSLLFLFLVAFFILSIVYLVYRINYNWYKSYTIVNMYVLLCFILFSSDLLISCPPPTQALGLYQLSIQMWHHAPVFHSTIMWVSVIPALPVKARLLFVLNKTTFLCRLPETPTVTFTPRQ